MMTLGPGDFVIDTPAADAPAQDPLAAALTTPSPSFTVTPEPAATRTCSAHLAGHLRLAAVPGRADAPVRTGQPGRSAAAEQGRRHAAGRTAGDGLAETPPPGRRPARRGGAGPDHRADQAAGASAHRQGAQHGQRHPAAQRRRQDRGPAGRAPHHGDRASTAAPSAAATGTTAELPPLLTVTAVRGYPAQARTAASLLATAPGVSYASQNVFTMALTALGRHPADYTSGVEAEITATMPAPVAVARRLLRLLDTLELNVNGVLRDIDTEFLHDLRVAVRRRRSAIKLLGGCCPPSWPNTTRPSPSGSAT